MDPEKAMPQVTSIVTMETTSVSRTSPELCYLMRKDT